MLPVEKKALELQGWSGLLRTAAACGLLAVGLILLDIGLSFAGGDSAIGRLSVAEWFAHLQRSPLLALRNLGLINVINIVLTVPFYLALARLHSGRLPGLSALTIALFLLAAAVYIAGNQALTMLSLSGQYAAAGEAGRAAIEAAGTVVIAQAEDFTPATLPGFLLSVSASLLASALMLRGGLFRRWISLAGLAGWGVLLVFTIWATFAPDSLGALMPLAALGGLLTVTWQAAASLGLLRHAGTASAFAAPAAAAARGA